MLLFSLPLLYCLLLNFEATAVKVLKKNTSLSFLLNIISNCNSKKILQERNKHYVSNNRFRGVNYLIATASTHGDKLKGQNEGFEEDVKDRLHQTDNTSSITTIKNINKKSQEGDTKKIEKGKSNRGIRDIKKDTKLHFFKKRIIFLTDEINKKTSDEIISQLLYLDSVNNEDITIFINSPGGSINDGLAILDIFHFIKSDIQTISYGLVASMGSVILAAGKKGKRKAMPNCRIMIHQPLGNAYGQPEDIEIQTKEILYLKNLLYHYLSVFTNQTTETIRKHSDRDYYMSAFEAKEYGIVDEVIDTKLPHPKF